MVRFVYNELDMLSDPIEILLDRALQARATHLEDFPVLEGSENAPFDGAFRLFNGFLEGCPSLVVDLYGRTLVLHDYAGDQPAAQSVLARAVHHLRERVAWVQAVIVKQREAGRADKRGGIVVHGQVVDKKIRELGVWYAIDLTLNLDASLYLDTRNLRGWAIDHLAGQSVLNTFAYTGSLGVAALAGGASRVVQLDLNRRFLELARASYALNDFPVHREDFLAGDFWLHINRLKRSGQLFDCVMVDPPFFSLTGRGRVDLISDYQRVINKVRPLVGHGGTLIVINNALFLSGAAYLRLLEQLCADGYLAVETLVPVPADFTGFAETRVGQPPADPAPFNHSTKIAILRVKRKDLRPARPA